MAWLAKFAKKYPLIKNMTAYAILWPSSKIVQQTITEDKNWNTYDYKEAGRYCIYGTFYVGPTFHYWMRFLNRTWPQRNLKTAITKTVLEQLTYSIFAVSSFYIGLNLLEGHSFEYAVEEWCEKFLKTYTSGLCFWPFVQTFNFLIVPTPLRVPLAAFCSFVWTIFLAYMKGIKLDKDIQQISK